MGIFVYPLILIIGGPPWKWGSKLEKKYGKSSCHLFQLIYKIGETDYYCWPTLKMFKDPSKLEKGLLLASL